MVRERIGCRFIAYHPLTMRHAEWSRRLDQRGRPHGVGEVALAALAAVVPAGCGRIGFEVAGEAAPADGAGSADGAGPIDAAAFRCSDHPGYEELATGCYRLEDTNNLAPGNAELACEADGGHLAEIESAADQAAVRARWPTTMTIGLLRPAGGAASDFRWVTDRVPTYLNWTSADPDPGVDCARMLDTTGEWDAEDCGQVQRYLCEVDGRAGVLRPPL